MLVAAEGGQIDEHGVVLRVAGILASNVGGVGVHGHDLGLHILLRVGQIDAVAQRLAHLGLAVDAGQAQAGLVVRQHDFRLGERVAIDRVELVHDLPALLEHGQLILAHRHGRGTECGDVGRLTDGIAEEADGNAGLEIALLNLGLDGGVALHAGHRDQIHIVKRQLGQLRHHGLDEYCGLGGIDAAGQIVQRHLHDVAAHLFGMLGVVGERLRVGDHDVDFVVFAGILQPDALLERADVMPHMETAGRAVAGQYDLLH